MSNIERELGNFDARLDTIESELQTIKADVRHTRDVIIGLKGGWRGLTFVGMISGAIGAIIATVLKLAPFIAMLPK